MIVCQGPLVDETESRYRVGTVWYHGQLGLSGMYRIDEAKTLLTPQGYVNTDMIANPPDEEARAWSQEWQRRTPAGR